MTEGNVEPTEASETLAYHQDKDTFLQEVVRFANLGLGIGVTLVAEGALISGTLIGGKQYFESLGKAVSGGTATGFGDEFDVLKTLGDSFATRALRYVRPDDAGDEWELPDPAYVHLENARLYSPGGEPIPSGKGMLWRGKINAISGFSIGSFDSPS